MTADLNLEHSWQNVEALVPIYEENGGNSTKVYLEGGEKIVLSLKTKTVLKKLARVFAIDLSELRKKYGRLVGRRNSSPLPLHPNLILVPLKYREPLAKDEGASGYIVKSKFASFCEVDKNKTEISFQDGSTLEFIQSLKSVRLMFAHAEVIEHEFINNMENIKGCIDKKAFFQMMNALSFLDTRR